MLSKSIKGSLIDSFESRSVTDLLSSGGISSLKRTADLVPVFWGFMACLSPFITFFLEWFDDGGRHLSFVYVYDGNVHVYFSEEILLYFG